VTALTLVFFGMALYGALTGMYGPALISLAMAGFMIWASKVFKQQEQAWARDPRNASNPPCTLRSLDEAGVECSSPTDRA
jgi:hypothetical protein